MSDEAFPTNQDLLVTPNVRSASNQIQKTWAAYDGVDFSGSFVCYEPGETADLPANFEVRSVSSAAAANDCN